MKKVIIASLILLLNSIYAQSPVSNGTYSIGGNISFSSYSGDLYPNTHNVFNFSPNIGYFFIDNLYTGMSLSYIYQSSKDYSSSTYGFGPSIRYYFDVEKVKPFLGLEYIYSYRSSGDDPDENTSKNFTMSAGVDYFITNYFALEGSINYSLMRHDFEDGYGSANYDFKELNIGIGAKFFIQ